MKTAHSEKEIYITEVLLSPISFCFTTRKTTTSCIDEEHFNTVFANLNGFYIMTKLENEKQLDRNIEAIRQKTIKYLDKCKEDLNHHYIKSDAE